jgi:hypothetical protein
MLSTVSAITGKADSAVFIGNLSEKLHENWTCHGIDHIPLLL